MDRIRLISAASFSLMVASCGTYVPQLHEAWEEADIDDPLVLRIKQSIYCELRRAVHSINTGHPTNDPVNQDLLPKNYGAQLTLMLQVDETGTLNPGITVNRSLGGTDLFTFGAGAVLSSLATRIDKYYSFFSASALEAPLGGFDSSCGYTQANGTVAPLDTHGSSPLLSGDLGIATWLYNAVRQQAAIPPTKFPKSASDKVDVLSYEVKFIVLTTGTANPTWKLVRFSTGTGSPLLSANRTRTHDLLLTFGPDVVTTAATSKPKPGITSPGEAAFSVHLASEIGAAVAGALRNNQSSFVAP